VRTSSTIFGRVAVEAVLSPEVGSLLRAVLDPLAAPVRTEGPDGTTVRDPRPVGERLHDALGEAFTRLADSADVPEQGGVRPHLQVTVDLAGLLDGTASGTTPDGLSLSPDTVARVGCDSRISWTAIRSASLGSTEPVGADAGEVVIDPDVIRAALATISPALGGLGLEVLAAGRAARTANRAQRLALNVRDRGCVVRGCTAPVGRCQAHHVIPWWQGGRTDVEGMALVCRAHHRFLHEHHWTLTRAPDGHWHAHPPPDALAA
jgi:hypothetical protein